MKLLFKEKDVQPVASGPKAHIDRAANKSQSYFVWKNSPTLFLLQLIDTTSFSMSSARPKNQINDGFLLASVI